MGQGRTVSPAPRRRERKEGSPSNASRGSPFKSSGQHGERAHLGLSREVQPSSKWRESKEAKRQLKNGFN